MNTLRGIIMLEKWEQINSDDDDTGEVTQRLKVHGGWLVLTYISFEQVAMSTYESIREEQYTSSQCFIPDPNHEWKL
jgi:hypothetical protein